jgi:hypothetical protein
LLLFNTLIEFLTSWAHCQVHVAKIKTCAYQFYKKDLYKLHLLFLDPPKLVPADGDELRRGGRTPARAGELRPGRASSGQGGRTPAREHTCRTEHDRHGRRLAPPFRDLPCFPDEPRSCTSPSSSTPPKESTRRASNHRRHCRFLTGIRALPPPNWSPPALLRPHRPHRRTLGEPPVPLVLSPSSLVPRRRRR